MSAGFWRRGWALPASAAALALCGCGTAISIRPVASTPLESLIAVNMPIYWLGSSFHGLPLSEVTRDRSGGVTLAYGACLRGGQYECLAPLTIVTSPEGALARSGARAVRRLRFRSIHAYVSESGHTYIVPAGPVTVFIYAQRRSLARAAGRSLAALNAVVLPGQPLPRPVKGSSYSRAPLSGQMLLLTPTGSLH